MPIGVGLSDRTLAFLMVAPSAVLIFVFALLPMAQAIFASFFQVESATLEMRFNGIENYRWLAGQEVFWGSLVRSLIWVASTTVAQMVLGVGIALLVHQELTGRNMARGLVLLPYLIPAVVLSLTWRFMLDPTLGVFNRLLMDFGLIERPIAFLADQQTALLFVIVAGVWKYTPFVVIMVLARLQVIPLELEDAAKIDGAGSWQLFRYITLPWLMPVLVITMLLRTIWSFRQFDIVYLFAFGGPLFGTTTLPVLVRYLAFDARRIGAAAATAVIMLVLLIVMSRGYFAFYARAEGQLD
ncbi:MAG: carbohydrate ABC transporter permease [Anaerolineales bacterium]